MCYTEYEKLWRDQSSLGVDQWKRTRDQTSIGLRLRNHTADVSLRGKPDGFEDLGEN